jgi:Predicted deacylase
VLLQYPASSAAGLFILINLILLPQGLNYILQFEVSCFSFAFMCFFVHTRFLDVGLAPNGNEIRIPVLEFISHDPGRTVYIQAGMHGGEVTIWVLDQIASLLKKSMISGKVVMVPIANPISWYQRIYFSVNGKFDFIWGKIGIEIFQEVKMVL